MKTFLTVQFLLMCITIALRASRLDRENYPITRTTSKSTEVICLFVEIAVLAWIAALLFKN